MNTIYSKSYGSVEQTERREAPKTPFPTSVRVPEDYHGSMYEKTAPPEEKAPPEEPEPVREKAPEKMSGALGGFLSGISAEDLLLFGALLVMLFGEDETVSPLLLMLLAVML